MSDIVGPADAVGAVTTRPADDRTFGALDSWFKDCTDATTDDGTDLRASFLNGVTALLRNLWRSNGKLADNVTPVVPEIGSADDALTRAVQYLIQRGQAVGCTDTGTTASHLVVAPTPAVQEYKKWLTLVVTCNRANVAGGTYIAVSGLPEQRIIRRDGSDLQQGDIIGRGELMMITFDGTNFEVLSQLYDRPTLSAARTYYVKATAPGSDANDGLTTGTPFATWQHALDVVKKLNLNGWTVTVQGLGGTYGAGAGVSGPFFGGGAVVVQGTGDLIVAPSGCAFEATYGAELNIGAGLVVQSNDGANGAVKAQFGGLINIVGDVHFNACTGYHIGALNNGYVRLRASYTVFGNAAAHLQAQSIGAIAVDTAGPISPGFAAGVGFSGAFAICQSQSNMLLGSYHFSGTPTGPRYAVARLSMIDVAGNGPTWLPGNSAGSVDATSIYG